MDTVRDPEQAVDELDEEPEELEEFEEPQRLTLPLEGSVADILDQHREVPLDDEDAWPEGGAT